MKDTKKEPQQDWWQGQRHSIVKTHTPMWATYRCEDNRNCRVSPQGASSLSPALGSSAQGATLEDEPPRTSGFEGQWG